MISCFGKLYSRHSKRPNHSSLTSDTENESFFDEPNSTTSSHFQPFSSRRSLTLANSKLSYSRSRARTNSSSALSSLSINTNVHPERSISSLPKELPSTKRRVITLRHQPDANHVNLQIGFRSRTGWAPMTNNHQNQDALTIVCPLAYPNSRISFFGIFDGHGLNGQQIAGFVAQRLPKLFHRLLQSNQNYSIDSALRKACFKIERAIRTDLSLDLQTSGTTAAICAVYDTNIVCANIGDSRIIVATDRGQHLSPLVLTEDHSPDLPEEKERIEAAGGRVDHWTPTGDKNAPARIWLGNRRYPGLSVSRVLGDHMLYGIVSSEPTITTHQMTENDRYLICASDGLWNVMSNHDVVNYIQSKQNQSIQSIAEDLVKHAASLWLEEGGETIDDITLIVVKFDWANLRDDKKLKSFNTIKSWRFHSIR